MISLILTFLLGLFCCSGVVNYRLDQQDNTVTLNDSLSNKHTADLPTDNIYPNQYFLSSGDMYFWDMYYYLTSLYGENMSYSNSTTYDFYIDNIESKYIKLRVNPNTDSGYQNWSYNTDYDLTRVRITKNVNNGYYTSYYLYMYIDSNYTQYVRVSWSIFYNLSTDNGSKPINGQTMVERVELTNISQFQNWNYYLHFFEDDWNFFYPAFIKSKDTQQQDIYNNGYNDGYNVGLSNGFQNGYGSGYVAASSIDTTASTIFTGILDVALIPVNVFLTIFNFEVFGINISGIVSGLLTLSVVIIIFRFLFGGNKDD